MLPSVFRNVPTVRLLKSYRIQICECIKYMKCWMLWVWPLITRPHSYFLLQVSWFWSNVVPPWVWPRMVKEWGGWSYAELSTKWRTLTSDARLIARAVRMKLVFATIANRWLYSLNLCLQLLVFLEPGWWVELCRLFLRGAITTRTHRHTHTGIDTDTSMTHRWSLRSRTIDIRQWWG